MKNGNPSPCPIKEGEVDFVHQLIREQLQLSPGPAHLWLHEQNLKVLDVGWFGIAMSHLRIEASIEQLLNEPATEEQPDTFDVPWPDRDDFLQRLDIVRGWLRTRDREEQNVSASQGVGFPDEMSMTDDEQAQIRDMVRDVLLPEDMRSITYPQVKPDEDPSGIWGQIGDEVVYYGSTFPVAFFTAKNGDWWIPERDGPVTEDDIAWFNLRATLGDGWKDIQTRSQFTASRQRIYCNYQNLYGDETY